EAWLQKLRTSRRHATHTEGLWLCVARAHGDDTSYRDYRDRYRAMATELDFEGHMAWAEAMP
ncbi:MAG: adenylate cyclase, partial [Mycobacterium sp.]|nr:adenylate cyclase [Mycobacterium sp.]